MNLFEIKVSPETRTLKLNLTCMKPTTKIISQYYLGTSRRERERESEKEGFHFSECIIYSMEIRLLISISSLRLDKVMSIITKLEFQTLCVLARLMPRILKITRKILYSIRAYLQNVSLLFAYIAILWNLLCSLYYGTIPLYVLMHATLSNDNGRKLRRPHARAPISYIHCGARRKSLHLVLHMRISMDCHWSLSELIC